MKGLFALFDRTLRLDAQRYSTWGSLSALLGLSAVGILITGANYPFGATGQPIYQVTLVFNMIYICAVGPGPASSAVTEEREEGTLGLLRLTPIHPVSILLGKLGGRLLGRWLVLAAQLPLLVLSVALGGVEVRQILFVLMEFAAFALFIVALGGLMSTLARTSRTSATLTFSSLAAYLFVPAFISGSSTWLRDTAAGPALAKFAELIAPVAFWPRAMELYDPTIGSVLEAPTHLFWFHVVAAILIMAIATFRFQTIRHFGTTVSKPKKKAVKTRVSRAVPAVGFYAWREFVFGSGGIKTLVARQLTYFVVFTVLVYGLVLISEQPLEQFREVAAWLFIVGGGIVCAIELLGSASRVLQSEIKDRTWTTLYLAPGLVTSKVAGKLVGALILPVSLLSLPLAGILLTETPWSEFLDNTRAPVAWSVGITLGLASLTLSFSVWIKQGPAAIAVIATFVGTTVYNIVASMSNSLRSEESLIVFLIAFFTLPLFLVPRRLTALARRDG